MLSVDEVIKKLQELSDKGYGNLKVASYNYPYPYSQCHSEIGVFQVLEKYYHTVYGFEDDVENDKFVSIG